MKKKKENEVSDLAWDPTDMILPRIRELVVKAWDGGYIYGAFDNNKHVTIEEAEKRRKQLLGVVDHE